MAELIVALGDTRYRIERPFGSWPANAGFVTDVAVDPRGHVFVMLRHDPLVHPADPRIVELSPDGRCLGSFGGDLIADSHYLTAAPDGRLLAVDRDMHEVLILSSSGERLGGLGTRGGPLAPFNHPTDVHVAAWGDIYVSDGYAAARIHRFAADGRALGSWGGYGARDGEFGWPHALWTFADGRVVVVDRTHHRVQVFDRDGRHLETWRDFHDPVGIWGDEHGNAYVSDLRPNLHLIGPDGTRLGRCRPVLNGAHGLSGNSQGDLYLAEVNPSRITRLRRLD
jgi:peptidylglycine monooxygenase